MNTADSTGDKRYRPLSTLQYMGYALLFAIPLLGLIPLILFSLDRSHINRRNMARAWLSFMVIGLVLFSILLGLLMQALSVQGARLSAFLNTVTAELQQFVQKLQATLQPGNPPAPSSTTTQQPI